VFGWNRRAEMVRRQFSREFKLEAVRLIRDRGVAVVRAAGDLDVGANVLRRWLKEAAGDAAQAFPYAARVEPGLALAGRAEPVNELTCPHERRAA